MRVVSGRLAGLLLLALLGACAGTRTRRTPRVDPNVLTQEQLSRHEFRNAYEAVSALRSNWLQPRGTDSFGSPGQVRVYLDDNRLGGVESLREIALTSVSYIRWYDGVTATQRWGLDHGQGVIFVSTHPVNVPR